MIKKIILKVLDKTINLLMDTQDKIDKLSFELKQPIITVQPESIGRFRYNEEVYVVDPLDNQASGPFTIKDHLANEDDSYLLSNGWWVPGIALVTAEDFLARTTN